LAWRRDLNIIRRNVPGRVGGAAHDDPRADLQVAAAAGDEFLDLGRPRQGHLDHALGRAHRDSIAVNALDLTHGSPAAPVAPIATPEEAAPTSSSTSPTSPTPTAAIGESSAGIGHLLLLKQYAAVESAGADGQDQDDDAQCDNDFLAHFVYLLVDT